MNEYKNKCVTLLVVSTILLGRLFASVTFSNDNARFVLKDWKSKLGVTPSTLLGWRDSSIVNKVSGVGLGDYDLRQYDYSLDNIIAYSDLGNSMQYINWDIPANTAVHIRENIYIDGYGGTINLGENSQLFVDDNVTLTLRNVTISNSKNFVNNPAIKLASSRSKLALDNVKIDASNDFYFNRGQLFVHNDVRFTGTSAFIYRSCQPSFITSGARLIFDTGTTFSVVPATFTACPYSTFPTTTNNNFILMADQTSQLYLNGCSLKTTLTGCRFRTGTCLFDNKVNIQTRSDNDVAPGASGVLVTNLTMPNTGDMPTIAWSPDSRYILAAQYDGGIGIVYFNGANLQFNQTLPNSIHDVYPSWSPDGKFVVGGPNTGNPVTVYAIQNGSSTIVAQTTTRYNGIWSTKFSPDGKYVAVACAATPGVEIFKFDGTSLTSVAYASTLALVDCDWSPDGKYLAVVESTTTANLLIYSFTPPGTLTLVGSVSGGNAPTTVRWSPDGRFVAISIYTSAAFKVYSFKGRGAPVLVGSSVSLGSASNSVEWFPDGKHIMVATIAASNSTKIYSFSGSTTPVYVGAVPSVAARGAAVSPNGQFISLGRQSTVILYMYRMNYVNTTPNQLVPNSIVFGNSAAGSASDINLKLLSGANVEVDGILNYDNVNSTSIFSSDNSRFTLKDWRSKIAVTSQSLQGWRDSSIVNKVTGYGLGDYNLAQYDYGFDNLITYSDVNNNMGAVDWNIPANTAVHIQENIYMDGYGGTINIGENSQLFVDDNVTLTLRNVMVSNSKNFAGNPPIKLATPSSKLALDNVKIDASNDFYFDRGNLFVHNDVRFTGTSAFVYRSCQPSFITSGANLIFDTGTTFSFAPATYTVCPYTVSRTYTANNFIKMADQTSKIIFNGADFRTTLTGLRLTAGEVDFDNNVNIQTKSMSNIPTTITASTVWSVATGIGSSSQSVNWSPDGRFVAVAGANEELLKIFKFTGSANPTLVGSAPTGGATWTANWSPDGRFVAIGNYNTLYTLQIFSFTGNGNPVFVGSVVIGSSLQSVNWSPDGKFVAVVSNANTLQIFRCTGSGNPTLVGFVTTVTSSYSVNWSPDGRFLAVATGSGNTLKIFSFLGSGNPVLIGFAAAGTTSYSANWSPDGRFVASVSYNGGSASPLQIFRFTGSGNPISVGSANVNAGPISVNWSPNGRFLAVVNSASPSKLQIFSFTGSGNPALIGSVVTGSGSCSVNWSPDGRFVAVGNSGDSTLQIFAVNYINDVRRQALSNSIVFGNSSLTPLSLSNKITSSYDFTVKLLSGANVSVDGILNIDNTQTNTNSVIFCNDNARFVLNNSNSKIRSNLNSMLGWRDSSITPKVSGYGLGDYNLAQYDYSFDNLITYSDVSNNMGAVDWNIPANTAVHIQENIYMDGYGGTINIGENSQLFVDDNITLTLRNVTVKSSKNGVGNPAIKLASTRSQLALDNAKLDFADDFYFDRGKLFAYNDVNFTGTNSFIYRSTVPSYIKSGANLKFNQSTAFDFRPSTTGEPGLLGKDLLIMDDVSSRLTLDGATLKSTLTGMRLAKGQILFDNKVSLTSQSQFRLTGTGTWDHKPYGSAVYVVNWSPDGRFLAVSGYAPTSAEIQVYSFNGSTLSASPVSSVPYGTRVLSVNWSPDGKYLAVGGGTPASGHEIQVYSFTGSTLSASPVASIPYGTFVWSVNWSPDGKYLAVGGQDPTSGNEIQVYSFDGLTLSLLANGSKNYGAFVFSVNWSPDGRYLAVGGRTPASGNEIQVYSFDGLTLSLLANGSKNYGAFVYSVNWSPDGRFLAVGGQTPDAGHDEIDIYGFDGNKLTYILSKNYGTSVESVNWSPDGRYLAVGGNTPSSGLEPQLYEFTGSALLYVSAVNYGSIVWSVNWSADGRFLALGGGNPNSGHDQIEVYTLQYGPETQTQAISNSIVLGNSVAGAASDVTLKLLSSANVLVDGIMNYDNTQGYTIFSSDNSRFLLKDSNSKIRMNPNTVIGWRDRSLVKNMTGVGQGDYNLINYDTTPPTDIIGYAEAPSELVYDNSNAVILRANLPAFITLLPRYNSNAISYLTPQVRTYSNALMSWPRQTSNVINSVWRPVVGNSNSIITWVKQTSNAAVGLDRRIRWNSNAIVKENLDIKNNSNSVVKLSRDSRNNSNAITSQDRRIRNNSNTIKFEADHFISVNNAKVTALGGISGTTNVSGRGFLSSPIDLQGGTLTLNSDMILSNLTTVVSTGNFDLQGNAMIFGGDLTLPANVAIKVVSSGVLDGQGNEFKQQIGTKLIVDNNVSLTLRNMNWAAAGSPQIEMRTGTSKLTLQNLSTNFDRDYSFTQGQLFIQDDVFVTGTNKFSYVSTASSYVMSHSTLYFDKNTTFSYSPRVTKRHTRSERNLIKLLNKTSEIYFNECTLQLPDSGWQLTKGTVYFDNGVSVYGTTTELDSFEFGDGIIANDPDVKVLAGAWFDNHGYVYYNPGN